LAERLRPKEGIVRVRDLMTANVVSVPPETPLKEVGQLLGEHRISGMPVVDGQERVLGVVSEADILLKQGEPRERHKGVIGWLVAREPDEAKLLARTAGVAMTSPAITVEGDAPAHEAARMMTDRQINRLPAVEGGTLVGIVTRADLVRAFSRTDEQIRDEIRRDLVGQTLLLPVDSVTVTVARGEVTLAGRVQLKHDAEMLPRLVQRVPGVVAVRSEVTWVHDEDEAYRRSIRGPLPSKHGGGSAG
jgi:CBS domain-containing protein